MSARNLPFLTLLSLAASFSLAACEREPGGGITAHIEWPGADSGRQRGLRTAAVPAEIGRLEILALDTAGSTLAATNLYAVPMGEQLALEPGGGMWTLDNVPVGINRIVSGRAYLLEDQQLILQGAIPNVEVRSGVFVDAGILRLRPSPGVRYPPLDFTAPGKAEPVELTLVREGEALDVTFPRPNDDDVAGYVIALASGMVEAPVVGRSFQPIIGDEVESFSGVLVQEILNSPIPQTVRIPNLTNGVGYTVVVYAYDDDLDNRPLNFSVGATRFAVPLDSAPPGLPLNLSVGPGGSPNAVRVSFTAPGEDDAMGLPYSYEVRTSSLPANLTNPAIFVDLDEIPPPIVQPAGTQVTQEYTFADLGVVGLETFYVGVRAVDQWNNAGLIAAAMYAVNATLTPELLTIEPAIALAGGTVSLRGRNLGFAGTVTLTTTGTSADVLVLPQVEWTDSTVTVTIPSTARSGTIRLIREDGASPLDLFLSVVYQAPDPFGPYEPLFEVLSVESAAGIAVGAVYREDPQGVNSVGAIDRIYGLSVETPPAATFAAAPRSTAVAGAFDAEEQRFYFVSSNDPASMRLLSVSSSEPTPAPEQTATLVPLGGADRVSLAVFEGGAVGETPALLAFSAGGSISVGTVNDLRTDTFAVLTQIFTATVGSRYDRVTVRANADQEVYLAYRELIGGLGYLGLSVNDDPLGVGTFTPIAGASRPRVTGNFELIAVPDGLGEEMVIAYEQEGPTGLTEVRLLRAADFGVSQGYAPFDFSSSGRNLEDVGVIDRGGEVWIAVLASRNRIEANYTEVPLVALGYGDARRGEYRGIVLDNTSGVTHGRLGCKVIPAQACPIVWLGNTTQALFFRR